PTPVHCSATDAHRNGSEGAFSITVQDTTPPTVTVPSNLTVEATGAAGATVTFSATALDIVDGSVSVSCSVASGSTFAIGITPVLCSATDAHHNTGTGTFNVTVQDTTPPALTLPSSLTAEATSAAGAAVSFSATAFDIVDGAVAVTCAPSSGSTFALGTTVASCSASDAHHNVGSAALKITVIDSTPPVITAPADILLEATGPGGASAS